VSQPLDGLLLVDKPSGVTSHDVVAVVRRRLGLRRIGHTGTLDPMAEGLLMLLIGRATRHQQACQGHDKVYEAILRFGTQTDTGDATGQPVRQAAVPALNSSQVERALGGLCGVVTQRPPVYSAIKVRGRPAYWWTRRQQAVELPLRQVRIEELSLLACGAETITFRLRCSAGTYVRTLGEAIAQQLGTVGHLAALKRLSIGSWTLAEATPLAWFAEAPAEAIIQLLRPVSPDDRPVPVRAASA